MSKEENKIVPQLRFPEFEEQWENEPLDQIYTFKITNSFSRDKLNYEKGEVKNIHYGDIHTKFSTLFDIKKEDVPFINQDVSISRIVDENYCKEGDIVIADASEDLDDIGKSIEIVNLNGEKLLAGLHTFLARRIDEKIVIGFGGYLFKSVSIRKQMKKEAQGAKVLGISKTRISYINIQYPKNPKEQQKIAVCLSSLDEVINAETEKLDLLKDHKKGLLQKLFPAEGETKPKFRFPEFKKDKGWTKKTFGKLFKIGSGRDYKHLGKGEIPVYGTGGYMLSVDDFLYEGKSPCIGRKGTINKPMFLSGKFWTVDTLFYTHSFKDCSPEFVYLLFLNINWLKYNEAGGVPSLSKDIIRKIEVFVPKNPKEQQKIAACLSSVDKLIDTQTQKIEQLKEHKKGLLQQLFPTINDVAV